jgi:hypothetical protein
MHHSSYYSIVSCRYAEVLGVAVDDVLLFVHLRYTLAWLPVDFLVYEIWPSSLTFNCMPVYCFFCVLLFVCIPDVRELYGLSYFCDAEFKFIEIDSNRMSLHYYSLTLQAYLSIQRQHAADSLPFCSIPRWLIDDLIDLALSCMHQMCRCQDRMVWVEA